VLLSVKDLWVYYNGAAAVRNVSFQVNEGTIVSLIGANGTGKSTILRTISGLRRPTSGEIWFEGRRIDGRSPAEIIGLGIAHVPEGRRLFSKLTVLENLRAGAYLRKDRVQIMEDLERIFEHFPILKERHKQQAGTLSGGEQQMLAIGRALMSRPKIIMMDEPSLGLAPKMISEVGNIISDIHQRGTTILLVEQNVRLALKLADRVCILETGKLILEGTAEELRNSDQIRKAYLGG